MPIAEIITIGTELLLGEIQDTNTRYLAHALRDVGVDLYRTMTVGDNVSRIAQAIQEALQRCDFIITTGGLGPTVDDPTRQAVAAAVGVDIEFRPELWEQIQSRFQRYGRRATENNKRQAFIPIGATPVENPVGTAPAFIVEVGPRAVISLPGVPREMEFLFDHAILPYLSKRYALQGTIKASVLHTGSVGESQIDELIGDLETLVNPTVGLAAHPGQVDIRVTAKAASVAEADQLIAETVGEIKRRLGNDIYGADLDTLEGVTLRLLADRQQTLVTVESGLEGGLVKRLSAIGEPFLGGETIPESLTQEQLIERMRSFQQKRPASLSLGAALVPGGEKQTLHLVLIGPSGNHQMTRTYGGPPQMAPEWGVNYSLDYLRKLLLSDDPL